VSYSPVINFFRWKNLQPGLSNEYQPRLLAGIQNVLIIVYQRHSNVSALILDKSSQDQILRGFPIGIKVSLFSRRSVLPTFNVSLIPKSPLEGKQNLFHQRRWDASHTCDCDRAIHKENIQRNSDWRFELTYDK
jgi:hypothetical protein